MMKCCTKYYFEGISQSEIAKQLGVSHPTVCRLIKQAREQGIVKIDLVSPLEQEDFSDMERQLEKLFHLKEAIVVADQPGDSQQKAEIGRVASQYLERVAGKKSVVGVSMGSTLQAVVNNAGVPVKGDHVFVPLIGGVGQKLLEVQSNQLANGFAKAFGGHAIFVHVPAFVDDPTIMDSLMRENSMQDVLNYYQSLDIAMVSIGTPIQGCTLMLTGFYSDETIQQLFEEGVVGDICMRFFDRDGRYEPYAVNRQIFGIGLDQLKQVNRSVGLASGLHKTRAAIGAMRAGLINVLITHRSLAESILNTVG